MRIVFVLLSLVLISSLKAQNIKSEKADVKWLRPPLRPFDTSIKTYRSSIDLVGNSVDESESYIDALKKNSIPRGYNWRQVSSGADLEFYLRLDGFNVRNERISSQQLTRKKDDKTTVTYTVYSGDFQYNYPMFYRVRDIKSDKIILERYISDPDKWYNKNTSQYETQKTVNYEIKKLQNEARRELISSALQLLQSEVWSTFSFYPLQDRWPIYYVETSKKGNYDDVMAARDETLRAVGMMTDTSTVLSSEFQEQIAMAIDKWELILKESNPKDKKARIDKKVTQAILQNIANCHFYSRNFTSAQRRALEAKELIKHQWQYDMEANIEEMKKRLDANKIPYK